VISNYPVFSMHIYLLCVWLKCWRYLLN